jgi:RNA polymerase sigma-70 factor (ECF subfamily)
MTGTAPIDGRSREAVERLYERFGRAMLAKVQRLLPHAELAQDVVQEAFFRLWRGDLTFVNEGEAYMWLYRCCHNLAVDHLRMTARRRTQGVDDVDAVVHADGGRDAEAGAERLLIGQDEAQQALAVLDQGDAQIFLYQVVDEMTQEEIAAACGVSRKTIQRALQRIEAALAPLRQQRRYSA